MQSQKILMYVSQECSRSSETPCISKLVNDFPELTVIRINSIPELFPLLSNPSYIMDYVGISVTELYETEGSDVFDIIKTLSTLIKCTVQRTPGVKPVKRPTKIFAVIYDNTNPEIIKNLMKIPEVHFTIGLGGSFTCTDLHQSISNILAGDFSIPKKIQQLIKSKKKSAVENSDQVSLTTRQNQIYNLIVERGSSNKLIAKTLGIAESTVKLHMGAILKKYGAKNRTQLVAFSKK